MMTAKLVMIQWKDHFGDSRHGGWQTLGEIKEAKPAVITSVGYIVRKDKKLTVLASTIDMPFCTNLLYILTNCIVSTKKLKVKK